MAIIKSYPLNDTLYTAEDAQLYNCTRTSGVFSDDDFAVTINGAMSVDVSPGVGWIKYDKFAGVVIANKSPITLNIAIANQILPRTDRVILRLNHISRQTEIAVKTGTVASIPQPPDLQRDNDIWELGIADITVLPETVTLNPSNIFDTRMDEELCGIMRDAVTRLPTQVLYNNFMAWFQQVSSILDENAVSHLLNRMLQLEERVDNISFSWWDLVLSNPNNFNLI
jgi:hypothetical protein